MARLSTHVLDLTRGCPAAGVKIELYRLAGRARELVSTAVTNKDGRTGEPLLDGEPLPGGAFELVFHAGAYFRQNDAALSEPPFLDEVTIRFNVNPALGSYHIPLLVAPYGYSTYRGS